MYYIFDTLADAELAESTISSNMGYTLPNRHALPVLCNNPNNKYYGSYYFWVGNVENKTQWLKDLDISAKKKEHDPNESWCVEVK